MCYDGNAQPPHAPGASGSASGEDMILTSADNTQFAAYYARPEHPTGAHVVIYPDVRGLHQFYKDLTHRFAEAGIAAIAFDYFGRTAGLTARDNSFEFWPHVKQIQLDTIKQDARAAQTYLRTASGDGAQFVVGFCMGGSLTLATGTDASFGFAGLIAFYAGLSRNFGGQGTVLEQADQIKYPVLGLFGAADPGIPPDQVGQFDQTLSVEHTIISYDGAPHSFFDRTAAEHADASADAWRRILDFIGTHTSR